LIAVAVIDQTTPLLEQEGSPKGGVVVESKVSRAFRFDYHPGALRHPSCSRRGVQSFKDRAL
jgi:hypothetical protein